jgi:cell division septum initiation protein DivIVA
LDLAERTAEQFVAEARSEADRLLAEARSRSEEMSREAEERERRALGELDRDRSALDRQVDELRAFEREYRSRLRAYLEDQLQQLDTSPDVAPALPPGVAAALDAQPSRGLPPGNEPPGPVPADGSTPPHEPG